MQSGRKADLQGQGDLAGFDHVGCQHHEVPADEQEKDEHHQAGRHVEDVLPEFRELRVKESTKICPLTKDVMGSEKPITTPPVKATISYVPIIGLEKIRRITSHVVRLIMNTSAIPATTCMHLLKT